MYTYTKEILINASQQEVFAFHTNHDNLSKITPKGITIQTHQQQKTELLAEIDLDITHFGILKQYWKIQFTRCEPYSYLNDSMIEGPFKQWDQFREFVKVSDSQTLLKDAVSYTLPFGILGRIAHTIFVKKMIVSMFTHRQKITKELLEQNTKSCK